MGDSRQLTAVSVPLAAREAQVRQQAPTAAPTLPVPTDRDTQQPPGEALVDIGEDLLDGSVSLFRGIARAGGQLVDTANGDGPDNREAAHRANKIILRALKQAATHPREAFEIIKQAAPIAGQYIKDNPGRVIGRVGTGVGAGYMLSRIPLAGVAPSATATYGDLMHALRNGANSSDDIMRAILGGESPEPSQVNQPNDTPEFRDERRPVPHLQHP